MEPRPLRARLSDGETVFGLFQTIPSTMITESIGLAGFDFTILDQEHGPITATECMALCAAAENSGMEPIIRVRDNTPGEIQRALDTGAGVEIPQIESLEDARDTARAARFSPIGERGLSPYVRAGGYDGGDGYTGQQNEKQSVIVHIEGERAVDNVEEIMDVEGIDVIFIGPYDLSQSLGIPGDVRNEQVEELMESVCEIAMRRETAVGTYADDIDMATRWIDAGVQFLALSVDASIIRSRFEGLCDELPG